VTTPPAKRQAVQLMTVEHRVLVERARHWADMSRAAYHQGGRCGTARCALVQ
jgi:hypothetical protein